ncbi:hypothetical protein [Streptomyces sp. SID9727]|uniref:hypothetical protein n=1 Tax=Streptomyces sp. SID9727 TaxID=2706114 RepID=UPI0013C54C54|nr:hypothetical protein [Streptomyces sp. SID9727]NEC66301.1 hypothetical protein [Streptomyces sp. SID9727]
MTVVIAHFSISWVRSPVISLGIPKVTAQIGLHAGKIQRMAMMAVHLFPGRASFSDKIRMRPGGAEKVELGETAPADPGINGSNSGKMQHLCSLDLPSSMSGSVG